MAQGSNRTLSDMQMPNGSSIGIASSGNELRQAIEAGTRRLQAEVEVGCLITRYKQTRSLQDLQAVIAGVEAVLEATPEGHPNIAKWLNNLGVYLSSRYQRTGGLQDLEAAIKHVKAAVVVTPGDHYNRASLLSNLGSYLGIRYKRTGDLQDLEVAIEHAKAAVVATPGDHPGRAGWLNNLGNRLGSRYERTGDLQDLEAAIEHAKAAVEATPEGHYNSAALLHNLGGHLSSRYKRTGDLQDLEGAIKHAKAAVEATPEGHPDRAGCLNNLGSHLSSRYERIGDLQDLEAAIEYAKTAVEATPEGHPGRAGKLNNLGNRLSRRYKRTGDLQGLEAVIEYAKAAVEATPEGHHNRAALLNNLGDHLSSRYEWTGDLQDLEGAIEHAKTAVEATPEGHYNRADLLNNLGDHLSSRYEQTEDLQDLEAAIEHAKAAVEATPEGHPGRAMRLINLANHLQHRYKRTGDLHACDFKAAIAAWLAAWSTRTAPILVRLIAALGAAEMLTFNPLVKDLPRACSLLHDATHLIPLAILRFLDREDQQHILGNLAGLASLAVSVSLEANRPPLEALQLQELGRSITNGQLLDYRADISDLMEQHPTLAKVFDSLRQELDTPFSTEPSNTSMASIELTKKKRDASMETRLQILVEEATIGRRQKVAQDLDDMLFQIRQKPGFNNFLRAESDEYFLSAAQEGPIVVLNVTKLRSDAILLTKTQVTSIALSHLSHDSMMKYFGNSETRDSDKNEVKRELLEWLWKAAVQPVLRGLGFYPGPNGVGRNEVDPLHLPRIWWIGVDLMAKAPIHAATKFKGGRVQMTTLQYCLPSYTSTIRALQYSRSRQFQEFASALIVTMPTTPGESSLSGVTKEADEIKHSLRNFNIVETLKGPTAEQVLQALPSYSIAHFACHGVSLINPADSHLLLLKEHPEEVDKLRVKDISALKLPAARLAYLSACSTAHSTSSELVDEVTHIVSAFHIAGFPRVIGTLWPAQDEACQKMAADFYCTLSKTDDVAISYRNAVLGLMKQKPLQPMYWGPFIHFGA